jgi:tRNA A-37 threonylcarbamoyl transferase component Bud32
MTGVEGLRDALAGRYDVEREVGHGAMAAVFLARDLRYDRRVAVKVLNRELSAALGTERFLREIDILAHLNHPHILPLLDSGEAGGFLYYVMPFVEGESLRDRLERETQLPIGDALAIAREVALALDYAHRNGFIHRDVKPENILLSDGLALVADFGIARAVNQAADSDRLTGSGLSPGTPPYMSPEQASGGTVDSRCDIYALGCVLYELLAGQPPFPGPTAQAVLARHLADPVPPLRTVRPTVPLGVERAVLKALAKVPADRYATAGEFAAALSVPTGEERDIDWRKAAVLVATGAAVGAVVWLSVSVGSKPGQGASLDTTRYAILPFERDSGSASFNEDQLLHDAMVHWTGISVVDQPRILEALSRHSGRPATGEAAAVAKEVGAGRYVLSQVSRVGDSLRIHSAVYRASDRGPPLLEGVIKIGLHQSPSEPAFARLADDLLFGKGNPGGLLDVSAGTTSRPGRQEFAFGLDSVNTWNLTLADTAFNAASRHDPQYGTALLWLALVRSWTGAPVATWQSAAERAAARRERLSERDRGISEAVLARARGDLGGACLVWQRLARLEANDFLLWYGLADCQANDETVVPDATSPSKWQFRTSYYGALRAYERAFSLLPSILRSFRRGSYQSLRFLFKTSGNDLRRGRGLAPDTMTFDAVAEWQGDTVAFVPYPSQSTALQRVSRPGAREGAVRQLRIRFHQVALTWSTAAPQSADAIEALAISLQMLGDLTALDTLRRARALARDSAERSRIAASEVWMEIAFGLPANLDAIRGAVMLADSLLRQQPPDRADDPFEMAGLAALTGRADLAANYYRDPRVADASEVPSSLRGSALPLLAYASFGGPRDSLVMLERRVEAAVEDGIPLEQQAEARLLWIGRPATLAFPVYRFASLSRLAGKGDWLIDLQVASAAGDSSAVRAELDSVKAARRELLPASVTLDALYPEAELVNDFGGSREATAWLRPTLMALPQVSPHVLASVERAASLVRAMALQARLSERLGDRVDAAQWARAVTILWSGADPFLQPGIRQLRRVGE